MNKCVCVLIHADVSERKISIREIINLHQLKKPQTNSQLYLETSQLYYMGEQVKIILVTFISTDNTLIYFTIRDLT